MSSLLRPVHTNVLSYYNPYISMRLGILSTRWAFSSKTHRSENALENGSKRKHIHIMTVWTIENASRWKWWPKISQARVCSMRIEFNLRHNAQFYLSGTFWWGQSKTHQNVSVNANWLMRFWWQGKCILLKTHWCREGLFTMPIIYLVFTITIASNFYWVLQSSKEKQCLCKILRDKQGALWAMW